MKLGAIRPLRELKRSSNLKKNEMQQSDLGRKGIFLVNVFLNGNFSVWCFAHVFGSHLESSADLSYIVGLAMTICVCVVL